MISCTKYFSTLKWLLCSPEQIIAAFILYLILQAEPDNFKIAFLLYFDKDLKLLHLIIKGDGNEYFSLGG